MKQIIIVVSMFLTITGALADDTQVTPPAEARAPTPAQQWLELQRSGKSASAQAQPLSGEAMDRAHKRYIKSFERPIPEFYEHETPITR